MGAGCSCIAKKEPKKQEVVIRPPIEEMVDEMKNPQDEIITKTEVVVHTVIT